jgi:hypothetical protein
MNLTNMLLMHGWKWGLLGRVPQAFLAAQSLLDLTIIVYHPENSARIRFRHGVTELTDIAGMLRPTCLLLPTADLGSISSTLLSPLYHRWELSMDTPRPVT